MAKRAKRGGSVRCVWTLVGPDQIRAYREQHQISREALAHMLGVSRKAIQTWETGQVAATRKTQARLQALLNLSRPAASDASAQQSRKLAIETTGKILVAYFAGARVKPDMVGGLVRQVRGALC